MFEWFTIAFLILVGSVCLYMFTQGSGIVWAILAVFFFYLAGVLSGDS